MSNASSNVFACRIDTPVTVLSLFTIPVLVLMLWSTDYFAISKRCTVPALHQAPRMQVLLDGGRWLPEEESSTVAAIIRNLTESQRMRE
jgi:hypothetical protein